MRFHGAALLQQVGAFKHGAPLIARFYRSDFGTCIIVTIDLNCENFTCHAASLLSRAEALNDQLSCLPMITQETAPVTYYLLSTIRIWLLAEWQRQCERLRVENSMWVACPIPALAADLGGLRSRYCA